MILMGAVYAWSLWVTTTELGALSGHHGMTRCLHLVFIPHTAAAWLPCAVRAGHAAFGMGLMTKILMGSLVSAWGFLIVRIVFRVRLKGFARGEPAACVTRSLGWMVSAAIAGGIFVFVLGRGVRFNPGG